MRNTKSVAFPHVSLTRTQTHASRVAHIAVKDKGSTVVFLSGSGMERKKKRKREGESSCWWGWTESLQRHTDGSLWKERITCARLLSCHILIPGRAHLGTNFTPLHPTQSPTAEPPVMQPCSCQHFHLCAAVVWCQVHTHKHTLSPKPPQLACLMSVKNARWGGEDGVLTLWRYVGLCALHFYCYLREKKRKKREKSTI